MNITSNNYAGNVSESVVNFTFSAEKQEIRVENTGQTVLEFVINDNYYEIQPNKTHSFYGYFTVCTLRSKKGLGTYSFVAVDSLKADNTNLAFNNRVELFTTENNSNGYINTTNGALAGTETLHRTTNYIPVVVGRTYAFSSFNASGAWGAIYNSSYNFVTGNINDTTRFKTDSVNNLVWYIPQEGDSYIRLTYTQGQPVVYTYFKIYEFLVSLTTFDATYDKFVQGIGDKSGFSNVNYGTLVDGYTSNTTGAVTVAGLHKSTNFIPVDINKKYMFPHYNISGAWGAIYNSKKLFLAGTITDTKRFKIDNDKGCVYYTPQIGDEYIRLTVTHGEPVVETGFYLYATITKALQNVTVNEKDLSYSLRQKLFSNVNIEFTHFVNKPYVFNAKKALFFGDSITQGFVDMGSTTTLNGFPKLFSDKVSMTFTNHGVGGSTYIPGLNGAVLSALEKIQAVVAGGAVLNNYDYIFMAFGVNDWQLGGLLSAFETAVSNAFNYIATNFSGEVIVISPINTCHTNKEITSLNNYRNILGKYATLKKFAFVDGSKFPFPNESGTLATALFGDGKLHPSEALGYPTYAKSLQTILC